MAKRNKAESEMLARQIVHYYDNDGMKLASNTVRHFKAIGIPESTVRDMIRRYVEEGRTLRKKVGRKFAKKWTPTVVRKVQRLFRAMPNISVRNAALKLQMSRSSVSEIKVHVLGIKAHSRQKAPKYTAGQPQRAKRGCRKIYRDTLLSDPNVVLIMDDETYVPADPSDVPGRKFCHYRNTSDVPDEARFQGKAKFSKKFMVWQAIDCFGNITEPYIAEGTMNGEIYKTECIQRILIPFIRRHHAGKRIFFWLDMAKCHYRADVSAVLRDNGIEFPAWKDNAPNCPQARPIEQFWSICKGLYGQRKTVAKNRNSFKRIWRNVSRKAAQTHGQKLMGTLKRRLRQVAYGGVYAVL